MTSVPLVDPAQAPERLLRRAGDDLGAEVEQHQQVAQVAGEERHLVGAGDQHLLGRDDRVDRRLDVGARQLVRGVLDVDVVGGERRLELGVVEREQRRRGGRGVRRRRPAGAAAVLVAGGLLELGEALEAERLREAHDGARGGVGPAGQLLGGLEGGLVEVVDDVLGDVLLRARELVEAGADVGRQRLVAVGGLRGWRWERMTGFIGRRLIRRRLPSFLQRLRQSRGCRSARSRPGRRAGDRYVRSGSWRSWFCLRSASTWTTM